jgi:GST-like protein
LVRQAASVTAAPKPAAATGRHQRDAARLFDVLDRRLSGRAFIAGGYSIADMAAYPWPVLHDKVGIDLADYPNVSRWFDAIRERPAVKRAYAKGEEIRPSTLTDAQRKALFAQKS